MTIKIVIADDHQLVREGFKRILASSKDIEVVGEFSSGNDLLQQAVSLDCEVILLDISMPGISGVELISKLRAVRPLLHILIVSMHNDAQIVRRALQAGATGYIDKSSSTDSLIVAIQTVAIGVRFVDPRLLDTLISDESQTKGPAHTPMSAREIEILTLIASGRSGGRIAELLHLSPKTISSHKKRIMEKLKVTSTAGLIQYAITNDIPTIEKNLHSP